MNQSSAFHWIVALLNRHQIPFRVTGGLAAIAYGAHRPLVDIDLDFPENRFTEILEEVQPYITFGPSVFRDDVWDLQMLTLNFQGQVIDLGGINARIFDLKCQQWTTLKSNLNDFEMKNIFGIEVPVIPKDELMMYKTILSRDVDLLDLQEIS